MGGMDDHFGNDCKTKEDERIHIINDTDYPLLNSKQSESNRMTETVPEVSPGETAEGITPIPAAEATDSAVVAAEAADAAAVEAAVDADVTAAATAAEAAGAAET